MTLYDSTNSRSWQRMDSDYQTMETKFDELYDIAFGDITVFCGKNVRENTIAAYRKAVDLQEFPIFKKVLVLNTSTRQHWALKEGRKVDASKIGDDFNHHSVTVAGAPCGDLCDHIAEIKEKIVRHGIRLLIINSWEYAASGIRKRDNLFFQLRGLIEELELTVLIYSSATATSSDVGMVTRGRLGKLSAVAAKISIADTESNREKNSMAKQVATTEPIIEVKEKSDQFVGADGRMQGMQVEPSPAPSFPHSLPIPNPKAKEVQSFPMASPPKVRAAKSVGVGV